MISSAHNNNKIHTVHAPSQPPQQGRGNSFPCVGIMAYVSEIFWTDRTSSMFVAVGEIIPRIPTGRVQPGTVLGLFLVQLFPPPSRRGKSLSFCLLLVVRFKR